ncbi:MAG TPA: tetratricopeptide repeat protein [Vicinamibacterales bacterium]|nr:tetratricopeptide repeat protein [Vicinamibacterales bacterium]
MLRTWPVVAALMCAMAEAGVGAQPADLRSQALELAYNLDHEQAVQLLRRAVAAAPTDPAPHRTLASVLWQRMLFTRGAVTVDHYLGSFTRSQVDLGKPPADLAAEFRRSAAQAILLANKRLKAAPRDPQAHYDLGAALGLEASYIATVDGRLLAGLRAASRCYSEHERVLELDPSRVDAGLVVGTYRYLVSSLPVGMRVLAYVAGFGGGKEQGVELLERAAARANDARTDAMFALVLVYNREGRYEDALKVLRQLRELYPRNRLVVLEEASTALRAGRAADADAKLTQGLAALSRDPRPKVPGEEQLWRYKRGAARAALARADAIDDLRAATAPGAQAWVEGRARVEIARLAVGRGDRASARAEARQAEALCRQGNDPICVASAQRVLRTVNGR